jgi:alkanesulfonate monooxygenase SsuD/methylene tetrahydromethanopterin reductase-like flavin-dependent oxidoreductase (luciferase family)
LAQLRRRDGVRGRDVRDRAVYAAKQFVTADHAGRGRFGLNVVCGWNPDSVAEALGRISEIGFDGVAVGLVNYLDDFP